MTCPEQHPVPATEEAAVPTFDEAISTAADVLRQARTHVGMASTDQLVAIAEAWLGIASLLTPEGD